VDIRINHTYRWTDGPRVLCTECAKDEELAPEDRIRGGNTTEEECYFCGATPSKQREWAAYHGGYDLS